MKNKYKFKLIDIIVLMTMGSTLLYVISKRLPFGLGSFRYFWAPVSIIVISITKPKVMSKSIVTLLILYGIVNLLLLQYTLWCYMSNWYISSLLEEFYGLITFSIIIAYYFESNKISILVMISKISLVFIVITTIITNIALSIDSKIVRDSVAGFYGNSMQISLFNRFGVGGYGYAQALLMLVPILVFHIKKKTKIVFNNKGLWLVLFLIIITTLRSQIFANMLVLVGVLILSFAGSKKRKAMFRYTFLMIFFVLLIPNSFYRDFMISASQLFPEKSDTYFKLNDFAKFIENPDIDTSTAAGGRAERYPMLIEAFTANPFFGDSSYDSGYNIFAGSHLYWMSRLANWGIFGFYLFLYLLYKIYEFINRRIIIIEMKFYYFLSVLTFIVLGLMKNIAGREPWLFLIIIIPGLYLGTLEEMRLEKSNIKENNNVQE